MVKAREADSLLTQGKSLGPLHGIPFTAKDWFETKEFISAAGFDERRNFIPNQDNKHDD